MGNRCFHELKTVKADEVAEKMELDTPSRSIDELDLGSSVLTLTEVM
jgi:hypothetical protein